MTEIPTKAMNTHLWNTLPKRSYREGKQKSESPLLSKGDAVVKEEIFDFHIGSKRVL